MSNPNPFEPPKAHVTDIGETGDGETQPLRVWSYRGRIGRLRYVAWGVAATIASMFIGMVAAVFSATVVSDSLGNVLLLALTAVFCIPFIFWTIQRSHDMGWSGWTWLWTLIPLVVLVWIFNPGDHGRNRFGAPPPANTFGVHLLAWLLPFIFFFGILAAVALPAYNDYSKRAKAAQVR